MALAGNNVTVGRLRVGGTLVAAGTVAPGRPSCPGPTRRSPAEVADLQAIAVQFEAQQVSAANAKYLGVSSFGQRSASDLAGNALRGLLAEYLVSRAVAAPAAVRTEWDACDLVTAGGVRVEVESAAYLQRWAQRAPSAIVLDVAAKRGWDAATNTSAPAPCRSADVYVFALLAHRAKATLDPLDLTQWQFYVAQRHISTPYLGHRSGSGYPN